MRILFTGFEPFGGEELNPSWEAVKLLPDEIMGAEIIKRALPVEYGRSAALLREWIGAMRPDFVVCTGQAGGRAAVSVECCALNRDHASLPDNAGEIRLYHTIDPDGAAARFTSLPVEEIVEAVNAAGVACAPSFHAGTYVCNHVYYELLARNARGLFVHVPYIPDQAVGKSAPAMELSQIARALEAVAQALAQW